MDKILTKYFWVANLATLAVAAFFVASGSNELIAGMVSSMAHAPQSEVAAVRKNRGPKRTPRPRTVSGDIILDRNIFDSTAHDDDGEMEEEEDSLEDDGEKPLVPCALSNIKLLAAVASNTRSEWSFASLEVNKKRELYRIGDPVEDRTVSDITWRYVLLMGDSDECYVDMFGDDKAPPPRRVVRKGHPATPGNDKITATSEFERSVDRSVVDEALANPTKFAKSVRVRPYRKNGAVVGFRLRQVRKGSAIEQLGAQRGDVLHAVNGIELRSIDDAMSAYQKLRSDDSLTFNVTRRGKPVELKINIE